MILKDLLTFYHYYRVSQQVLMTISNYHFEHFGKKIRQIEVESIQNKLLRIFFAFRVILRFFALLGHLVHAVQKQMIWANIYNRQHWTYDVLRVQSFYSWIL